jgi:class 3 adenylate cyclase
MAAARQGLPVRLDRAPQRGAAFAITRASRHARTRSIGSRSRARGSSLIFDHPPAVAPAPPPPPRGFTAFAETAEPEEVIAILRDYYSALGALIDKFEGTVERFAGDGIMVLFNDPLPCEAPWARAVQMAVSMRDGVAKLDACWRTRGHDLGFGIGIVHGFATLGCIGFEGRLQYSATGTVANLASRLCDQAGNGQILVDAKVRAGVDALAELESIGDLDLKGFRRPVKAFNVRGLRKSSDEAA